jgi:hypothetical protein
MKLFKKKTRDENACRILVNSDGVLEHGEGYTRLKDNILYILRQIKNYFTIVFFYNHL